MKILVPKRLTINLEVSEEAHGPKDPVFGFKADSHLTVKEHVKFLSASCERTR